MMILDVMHGYQPFTDELLMPWVIKNTDEVFIPTSEAMRQGHVRHNVQLQGWTIDAWLKNHATRHSAMKILSNLKAALKRGHITAGCSSYSHAMLPLLSDELAYAQIRIDHDTVEEHIGRPVFLWYPECGMDRELLKLSLEEFDLLPIIPDNSIGEKRSMMVNITDGKKDLGKAAVANVLLKDLCMNAVVYKKPDYVPKRVNWVLAMRSMRDKEAFLSLMKSIEPKSPSILMRDWENAESRDALVEVGYGKDIKAMLEIPEMFSLFGSEKAEKDVDLRKVRPATWEPCSTRENPFPYWLPTAQIKKKMEFGLKWKAWLNLYDEAFHTLLASKDLEGIQGAKELLKDKETVRVLKHTFPVLLSCFPWHIMARPEWESFPEFPKQLLHKVLKPLMAEWLDFVGEPLLQKKADQLTDWFEIFFKKHA